MEIDDAKRLRRHLKQQIRKSKLFTDNLMFKAQNFQGQRSILETQGSVSLKHACFQQSEGVVCPCQVAQCTRC